MKRRSQDASSFTRLALLPNPKRRLSPRYIYHTIHTQKNHAFHTHTHTQTDTHTHTDTLRHSRRYWYHIEQLLDTVQLSPPPSFSAVLLACALQEKERARAEEVSPSLFLLLVTCIHAWNTYEIALRFSCLHLQSFWFVEYVLFQSLASRFRFPNFEYIHERDARTHQHRTRQCRPHRAMPNPEHRSCSSPPHNSIHMVFLLSEALRSTLH